MINRLLSYLAPHYCCGCGKIGAVVCEYCKYNIISEPYEACIACGRLAGRAGICQQCVLPYERAWCVGERTGVLRKVIDDYKFERLYDAHRVLGDMLLERIDQLPSDTVVVPVPTIRAHIRQRGYDHAALLAQHIARSRGLAYRPLVERVTTTKQRGAGKRERERQAKEAFVVHGKLDSAPAYLLVDDVVTTGATVYYASKALKRAGAKHVWVASVSRQTTLD